MIETLEQRKIGMIASLWSNPNFDDDKGTRQQAIADIEEKCEEAVFIILTGYNPAEEEIDDEYGFFEAGRRGQAKIAQARNDEGAVADVVDYSQVDQG